MSDARAVAIFADQVRVGMVIEHPDPFYPKFGGKVLVTQVRANPVTDVVFILGERVEDGSPYVYHSGHNMAWLCHDDNSQRLSVPQDGQQ